MALVASAEAERVDDHVPTARVEKCLEELSGHAKDLGEGLCVAGRLSGGFSGNVGRFRGLLNDLNIKFD